MVAKLKLQITGYKHDKFGASSERLARLGPLELLVELDTGRAQIEAADDVAGQELPARRPPALRRPGAQAFCPSTRHAGP
jgi:Transposase C of IS166 homeodomain